MNTRELKTDCITTCYMCIDSYRCFDSMCGYSHLYNNYFNVFLIISMCGYPHLYKYFNVWLYYVNAILSCARKIIFLHYRPLWPLHLRQECKAGSKGQLYLIAEVLAVTSAWHVNLTLWRKEELAKVGAAL